VKTLEDPDECNGAFIMRVLRDNMKGECRSLLMSMSMRIWCPSNDFIHVMWWKLLLQGLC